MLPILTLTSLLTLGPAEATVRCTLDGSPVVLENYRALYEAGVDYPTFLAAATRRTELWHGNSTKAAGLDQELVARARAVGGSWRFLVVAVDSCSDSVSTIPYLARLAALVEGIDLRIVDPTRGRAVMEANRTPDGRAATPTVLLLDAGFEAKGCFIERPRSLQDWMLENDGKIAQAQLVSRKMQWYADDAGLETVTEIVGILEAAAQGRTVCGR